jgi:hypothetical protein
MPPLRFIIEPITLPHLNPTTEHEISAYIAHINQAFASGNLDLDFYNALLSGQREHIVALKAREELPENQNIQITGGLPELPGTNIRVGTLVPSQRDAWGPRVQPPSLVGRHRDHPRFEIPDTGR